VLPPKQEEAAAAGDDGSGRALDHLFDAGRGALPTEVVVAVGCEVGVTPGELHNRSTTIRSAETADVQACVIGEGHPSAAMVLGEDPSQPLEHRPVAQRASSRSSTSGG